MAACDSTGSILPPTLDRRGRRIRLLVVHTIDRSAGAAAGLADALRAEAACAHVLIDSTGVLRAVDDTAAVPLLAEPAPPRPESGHDNASSLHAQLCAPAALGRAEWLGAEAGPRSILDHTAGWIAEACRRHDVPLRKIGPEQVAAGTGGVCGHMDWTFGVHLGTRTDPGRGFPWDYVMTKAARQWRAAGG